MPGYEVPEEAPESEAPAEPEVGEDPLKGVKTGDETRANIWWMLLVLALAVGTVTFVINKKKEDM